MILLTLPCAEAQVRPPIGTNFAPDARLTQKVMSFRGVQRSEMTRNLLVSCRTLNSSFPNAYFFSSALSLRYSVLNVPFAFAIGISVG